VKDTVEMAREAGIELDLIDEDEGQVWYITTKTLKAFEALVRADEREACAKVCDAQHDKARTSTGAARADACAAAIRARGNT